MMYVIGTEFAALGFVGVVFSLLSALPTSGRASDGQLTSQHPDSNSWVFARHIRNIALGPVLAIFVLGLLLRSL